MDRLKRLNTYLETVKNNINNATGELKLFWQREEKKTAAKIKSLT